MAWGVDGFNFSGGDKTSSSSEQFAAPTVTTGKFMLLAIAKDNASSGSDGDLGEVTGVSDTGANTWFKIGEFGNTNGAAGAGAVIALWGAIVTTALSNSTDTITVIYNTAITATAIAGNTYTIGANSGITVQALKSLANDAADPGSINIGSADLAEGLKEYMFVRAVAKEGAAATFTPTTNYTTDGGDLGTSGGSAATNMRVAFERRIVSSNNQTSDPTYAAADCASLFVALKEAPFEYHAMGFRFYNDDGSESANTAMAAQNTAVSIDKDANVIVVLRIGIQERANAAGASTYDYQLLCSHNGTTYFDVTTSSTKVKAVGSANLTDAGATTQRLTGITGTFDAGSIAEDGLVDNFPISALHTTEFVYVIQLVGADLANNDTLDFNIMNYSTGQTSLWGADGNMTAPRITATAVVKAIEPVFPPKAFQHMIVR